MPEFNLWIAFGHYQFGCSDCDQLQVTDLRRDMVMSSQAKQERKRRKMEKLHRLHAQNGQPGEGAQQRTEEALAELFRLLASMCAKFDTRELVFEKGWDSSGKNDPAECLMVTKAIRAELAKSPRDLPTICTYVRYIARLTDKGRHATIKSEGAARTGQPRMLIREYDQQLRTLIPDEYRKSKSM